MLCYTFVPPGSDNAASGAPALAGIALTQGKVRLGQPGRGRQLLEVAPPEGAEILPAITASIHDAAHYVQSREGIRAGRSEALLVSIPDRAGFACALLIRDQSGFRGCWSIQLPEGAKVIGRGVSAQGIAGRAGGGEELLALLPECVFTLQRHGRLYGAPSHIEVIVDSSGVLSFGAEAVAAADAAARAWA